MTFSPSIACLPVNYLSSPHRPTRRPRSAQPGIVPSIVSDLVPLPNQPDRPVISQVVPGPVHQHQHSIAKADQPNEVYGQPNDPGHEAAQAQPVDVGNRGRPSDCDHAPPVLVAEALRSLAASQAQDVFCLLYTSPSPRD